MSNFIKSINLISIATLATTALIACGQNIPESVPSPQESKINNCPLQVSNKVPELRNRIAYIENEVAKLDNPPVKELDDIYEGLQSFKTDLKGFRSRNKGLKCMFRDTGSYQLLNVDQETDRLLKAAKELENPESKLSKAYAHATVYKGIGDVDLTFLLTRSWWIVRKAPPETPQHYLKISEKGQLISPRVNNRTGMIEKEDEIGTILKIAGPTRSIQGVAQNVGNKTVTLEYKLVIEFGSSQSLFGPGKRTCKIWAMEYQYSAIDYMSLSCNDGKNSTINERHYGLVMDE